MEHGRWRTFLWGMLATASLCGLIAWLVFMLLAPEVGVPQK